jgi:hypothetical protein
MPSPYLHFSAHDHAELQSPFDVAIVMPSLLRSTLDDALQSIFAQRFAGRIQVLVGIDVPSAGGSSLERACRGRPGNVVVYGLFPGYSTSVRHGGLHPERGGGVLRTLLCYLANSRRLAFLDDDNWWHEDHLASLCEAIEGHDWAWAERWFVHPNTRRPVCRDEWESVGPGRGCFAAKFGGWVDPNGLMFDKLVCEPVLRWWSIPLPGDKKAMSGDRHVFHLLNTRYRGRGTGRATVYYVVDPTDVMHGPRLQSMGRRYQDAGQPAEARPAHEGAASGDAAT